jgi:RNase H-fold protein (predicted Holliday junction resolvase)
MKPIISIDPGKEKCGIAIVDKLQGVLWKNVITTQNLSQTIQRLLIEYAADRIVMGDGTTSKSAQMKIQVDFPLIPLHMVDEYRTTDEAKIRYWKENKPHGWKRFIPTTMLVPPVPVDDYVAVILAECYFSVKNK